jgi:hypothetical protein
VRLGEVEVAFEGAGVYCKSRSKVFDSGFKVVFEPDVPMAV